MMNKYLYERRIVNEVRRCYFGKYHKIKKDDLLITNQDQCIICLEEYKVGLYKRKLMCGHIFHKKCVDRWFKKDERCPICREYHQISLS